MRIAGMTGAMTFILERTERMRTTHEANGIPVPGYDGWKQKGDQVHWSYNQRYVDYVGRRISANIIKGKAKNIKKTTWHFTLTKKE